MKTIEERAAEAVTIRESGGCWFVDVAGVEEQNCGALRESAELHAIVVRHQLAVAAGIAVAFIDERADQVAREAMETVAVMVEPASEPSPRETPAPSKPMLTSWRPRKASPGASRDIAGDDGRGGVTVWVDARDEWAWKIKGADGGELACNDRKVQILTEEDARNEADAAAARWFTLPRETPAPSVSDHLLNALNLHRSKCGECSENVDGCELAQRIEAVMCEVNPSAYFTSEPIADDKEQP